MNRPRSLLQKQKLKKIFFFWIYKILKHEEENFCHHCHYNTVILNFVHSIFDRVESTILGTTNLSLEVANEGIC